MSDSSPDDRRHMAHALRLARRGLGNVWPNPAVGCVLVDPAGRIVGRGWTQPGGRPHAERMALDAAGPQARGATAYVTLEPCAHHGRTPPCASGLIQAGVARVVSALRDPDPRTAGRGLAMLQQAGISVSEGVHATEAHSLQRGFLLRITENRPLLTLKLATSLDGGIAMASGESQWITGPAARAHTHLLRSQHDAIMVGGNTARHDRPSLNIRNFRPPRQPVRIVVSSRALPELPPEGPDHGPLLHEQGDPTAIMHRLAEYGLTRILCEGGGHLAAQLLAANLVDDLTIYRAGLTLGADARPGIAKLPFARLADTPRFNLVDSRRIGPDLIENWHRA